MGRVSLLLFVLRLKASNNIPLAAIEYVLTRALFCLRETVNPRLCSVGTDALRGHPTNTHPHTRVPLRPCFHGVDICCNCTAPLSASCIELLFSHGALQLQVSL